METQSNPETALYEELKDLLVSVLRFLSKNGIDQSLIEEITPKFYRVMDIHDEQADLAIAQMKRVASSYTGRANQANDFEFLLFAMFGTIREHDLMSIFKSHVDYFVALERWTLDKGPRPERPNFKAPAGDFPTSFDLPKDNGRWNWKN